MHLLRALTNLLLLLVVVVATKARNDSSLCAEQLERETGFINDLYYLLYNSSSSAPPSEIPLVLWLSGGPGCSGLVAALFELGPCMFDDDADAIQLNEFAWTNHAHVVFIDQPHGTGFSAGYTKPRHWTERRAMEDLANFVDAFLRAHAWLHDLDFFIFGESYGGHYAPDLGATLVRRDPRWRSKLKGVGIGNGVVSPIANLQTYLEFATHNKYATNIVGSLEEELRQRQQVALELSLQCRDALQAHFTSHGRRRMRARALETNDRDDDDDDDGDEDGGVYPAVCSQAASASSDFEFLAVDGVQAATRNMYDIRKPCDLSDPLGLCYRLSRLETFVNDRALDYFGVPGKTWSLCSATVMRMLWPVEFLEQSDGSVAFLLDSGVRVLVYAGDADTMAPWNMQDRWTHDLNWSGGGGFRANPMVKLTLNGVAVGEVRSAYGLSLVRVYESGHMVPHDQPQFALEMLRSFTSRPRKNDGTVDSAWPIFT